LTVDAIDVVEISQVLARYGQIVDTRAWSDLAQVFTGDAVFDIDDFDRGRLEGLDAIRAMFEHSNPPYSVHIVNVVVRDGDEPRTARAYSKNLGLLPKGRVGSASYEDDLVKTDDGWRVVHRLAIARREARP
jgi:hypothetical protein